MNPNDRMIIAKFPDWGSGNHDISPNIESIDFFLERCEKIESDGLPAHHKNFKKKLEGDVLDNLALFETGLTKEVTDIWKKEYKIITLTAKGQSYFDDAPNKQNGKRVIIAKFEPVEIIGISYLENKAQVKFKTRLTKTPFYELIGIYNKPRCVFDIEKNTTKEETVTLIKYDTGWQINKK